jgi:ankyrin repeat protein
MFKFNSQEKPDIHEYVSKMDINALSRLLKQGANVDACDDLEQTALHLCADSGWLEGANLLLQAKADNNTPNLKGQTPLHRAIYYGQLECAEAILSAGDCNVDAKDDQSKTALHYAAELGWKEAVSLLLSYGANPNINDKSGKSALHILFSTALNAPGKQRYAMSDKANTLTAIAQELIAHGADVDCPDLLKNTARTLAKELGIKVALVEETASRHGEFALLHYQFKSQCGGALSWAPDDF